ncbi:MAG: acetyl-CoA C-acetyltransferase [Mycobacterium sp.]
MTTSVIVAGARTPVGKLMGSLKDFSGTDLGAVAIAGALEKAFPKAAEPASLVEYVIMGQVLTAGAGQMPARQAAVAAGIGWDVPSLTINKMCLSGIDAIALADQLIRAGEFDVVVAGGQESMTKAPHLLMDSRSGYKYGDVSVLDHMAYDGLHDIFTDQPMGALTEQRNDADQFTRAEQDEFAAASHQKAAAAWKDGVYADEVVPVSIPQRKGDPIEFTQDEGIRANTTAESLAGLRPAFRKDGTITAGSASQISDGACAVVVMNKAKAEELGLSWLCEIGAHGVVAGPDSTLQSQPANAIRRAVAKEGITLDQLDVIEINEAFSAVALASTRELGVDPDRVNTNGGAIAIGHPIGMSGARITLHVALELARLGERSDGESGLGERSDGESGRGERSDGARYGVAALCGAGGQGDALILRCP